jgi:hypothetical protein
METFKKKIHKKGKKERKCKMGKFADRIGFESLFGRPEVISLQLGCGFLPKF